MPKRSNVQKNILPEAPPSGENAYSDAVRILRNYHPEGIPDMLAGYEIADGRLVLKREWVCSDECPIAVMRIHSHPAYPLHRHEFTEISIVVRGLGMNRINGHEFELKAGNVFVMQGVHEHSIESPQSLEMLNICYLPELLGFDMRDFPDTPAYRVLFEAPAAAQRQNGFDQLLTLNPEQLARIVALANELDVEIQQSRPGYLSVARACLVTIIALLCRWYNSPGSVKDADTRRVAKAIIKMEQQLEDNLSPDDLSKMCGLSRRQFFRVFKQCTGQTPSEYLLHLRLRRAERLLRDHIMSVTEVAFAAGFNDSNYFSKSFKKIYGITPSEYRAAHQSPGGYSPSPTKPPIARI